MRWSPVNHASVVPWRRRAPQSPSSSSFGAPQGNNKIYTYNVVFPTGEAKINKSRKTPFPYKITKDISQPQFDKPAASQAPIRRLQVISILYRKYSQSRTARYWMPRHPRTCRTEHTPTASQNYRARDKVPTECEKFAKIRGILLHDGDRIGIIVSWGIFPTKSENVGGLRI